MPPTPTAIQMHRGSQLPVPTSPSSREPVTGTAPCDDPAPPRLRHDTQTGIAPVIDHVPSNNPAASPSVTPSTLTNPMASGVSHTRRTIPMPAETWIVQTFPNVPDMSWLGSTRSNFMSHYHPNSVLDK